MAQISVALNSAAAVVVEVLAMIIAQLEEEEEEEEEEGGTRPVRVLHSSFSHLSVSELFFSACPGIDLFSLYYT